MCSGRAQCSVVWQTVSAITIGSPYATSTQLNASVIIRDYLAHNETLLVARGEEQVINPPFCSVYKK